MTLSQYAPSGRASCKKCKEKIEKGDIRMTASKPGNGDFLMDMHYHPACFPIPKKYAQNMENFLTDVVFDKDNILPDKLDEILAARASKKAEAKAVKTKNALLAKLDEALKNQEKENGGDDVKGEEPSKKKLKTEQNGENFEELVQVYKAHHTKKNDELKEILR